METSEIKESGWEAFEREVATLFTLQGYSVQPHVLVSGKKVDIYAEKRVSQFTVERLAIECKFYSSTLPIEQVKEVTGTVPALIGSGRCDIVVLVSNKKPSAYAMRIIEDTKNLRFLTYEQLLYGIIDFTPYVWKFIRAFESSELFKSYIPIKGSLVIESAYIHLSRPEFPFRLFQKFDVEDLIEYCLEYQGSFHISMLGDYGTGKTSFAMKLTHKKLKEYLKDTFGKPIPIYIPLRDYSRSFDIKSMITSHLVNAYSIRTDFFSFQELLRNGKLLIILDGFDEMSMTIDPEIRRQHFIALSELQMGKAKVILTGRSGYFFSVEDLDSFLNPHAGQDLYETEFTNMTNHFVLVVEPFTKRQIASFVENQASYLISKGIKNWTEVRDAILNTYTLRDLSSRPVILDMLVKAAPHVKDYSQLTTAKLYNVYTAMWINRDYNKGEFRRLFGKDIKEKLMQELALDMFYRGVRSFEINTLRESIKPIAERMKIPVVDRQFDYFEHDIRTCSFLALDVRKNSYRFAHQSFFEFFVAKGLVEIIVDGRMVDIIFARQLVSDEMISFLEEMVRAHIDYDGIQEYIKTTIWAVDELRKTGVAQMGPYFFTNLLQIYCRLTGGSVGLKLRNISIPLLELKGSNLQNVDFSSAEFTDLALLRVKLTDGVLHESRIKRGRFDDCEISRTSLSGSSIIASEFCGCQLQEADFSNTTLEGVKFPRSILRNSKFCHANIRFADFSEADITGCDFTGAKIDLNDTKLNHSQIKQVKSFKLGK